MYLLVATSGLGMIQPNSETVGRGEPRQNATTMEGAVCLTPSMTIYTWHKVTHVPQTGQLLVSHRLVGLFSRSVIAPWI